MSLKSCVCVVSNVEKIYLDLMKDSYKTRMKTVTRDTYLKSMLSIPSSCTRYIVNLSYLKIGMCEKIVCNLHSKGNDIDIKALKQALDHGLILECPHGD